MSLTAWKDSSNLFTSPNLPPPKFPENRSLESRLASFVGWPERLVGQSPRRLAACGFFYIGSADRVRCFQCGVTLRNWEAEDDPATEHLTWVPDCPVALLPPDTQSQTGFRDVQAPPESEGERGAGEGGEGSGFESPSRNFEELGVSIAYAESVTDSSAGNIQSHVTHSSETTRHSSEALGIPGADSAASVAAAVAAAGDPPSVQAVLELGCCRDAVDRVRERRRRVEGTDFPDAQSLLLAVWESDSGNQAMPQASTGVTQNENGSLMNTSQPHGNFPSTESAGFTSEIATAAVLPIANVSDSSESEARASPLDSFPFGEGAQVRRRQLRFRQCQLCPQGEITVTFLPCGHLIACSACTKKCRLCPRCGKKILGTVRTFFA